jgi:hypothetical protein
MPLRGSSGAHSALCNGLPGRIPLTGDLSDKIRAKRPAVSTRTIRAPVPSCGDAAGHIEAVKAADAYCARSGNLMIIRRTASGDKCRLEWRTRDAGFSCVA